MRGDRASRVRSVELVLCFLVLSHKVAPAESARADLFSVDGRSYAQRDLAKAVREMTVRFPDEPGFQGRFAPVRMEGEIRGVEVTQGEIPRSLRGTYYRVGADPA